MKTTIFDDYNNGNGLRVTMEIAHDGTPFFQVTTYDYHHCRLSFEKGAELGGAIMGVLAGAQAAVAARGGK